MKYYPAALADFNQAIALDPNLARAYLNRGIIYGTLKDYSAALADYTQAIALNPNYAKAYYGRGITNRNLKDYPAALADFNKSIVLDPNLAQADYNHQVIPPNPNDAASVYSAACAYALQSQLDLALDWLRRAITMDNKYLDMARTGTDFDALRAEPAFHALLAEFTPPEAPSATSES